MEVQGAHEDEKSVAQNDENDQRAINDGIKRFIKTQEIEQQKRKEI